MTESPAEYIDRVTGSRAEPDIKVAPTMIRAGHAVHGNILDGQAVVEIYRAMVRAKDIS